VIFSGEQAGYGNIVVIDHGDGLISKYAHNKTNLVREGDQVDANTVIAHVGYTGRSTGPHLHLEIQDKQGYVDPVKLLARG
jgi:murein DD-endopeptidase MepM/ murein hydrolase activator NlpD